MTILSLRVYSPFLIKSFETERPTFNFICFTCLTMTLSWDLLSNEGARSNEICLYLRKASNWKEWIALEIVKHIQFVNGRNNLNDTHPEKGIQQRIQVASRFGRVKYSCFLPGWDEGKLQWWWWTGKWRTRIIRELPSCCKISRCVCLWVWCLSMTSGEVFDTFTQEAGLL